MQNVKATLTSSTTAQQSTRSTAANNHRSTFWSSDIYQEKPKDMPSGCYNCTTLPLRFTGVEYENSKDLSKQLKLASELLNEEFQCYKRVARSLMKTLIRQKDLKICDILIKRCSKLNGSENLKVKKEINGFFKYFLKILCWTSDNQPIETYENWKNPHHAVCKYKANAWLNKHWATKLKQDGSVSIHTYTDINKYNWQNKDLAA